jgi:hypothetical protein
VTAPTPAACNNFVTHLQSVLLPRAVPCRVGDEVSAANEELTAL